MTETTTTIEPQAAAPIHPADMLLQFIVTLLAPMFLTTSGGDIVFARLAATHIIKAYHARNQPDLVAVAQVLAFGLAALGSLSMSLADGVSMSMALRLRGNANACNRSAEQNRRAVTGSYDEAPVDLEPDEAQDVFLTPSAEAFLAAESQARLQTVEPPATPMPIHPEPTSAVPTPAVPVRNQNHWATAIGKVASNITASIPGLPPAERRGAEMRATLLSSTAHQLLNGATLPPFDANTLSGVLGLIQPGPRQPGPFQPGPIQRGNQLKP